MGVALVGPVGSGKSNRAQRLSWSMPSCNRMPKPSTGDLVRARTPSGAQAHAHHDTGDPAPDDVVLGLLLPHARTAGVSALDDFPANPGRAETRGAEPEERSTSGPHYVVSLEGPSDDGLVEWVLGGRVLRGTGGVFRDGGA